MLNKLEKKEVYIFDWDGTIFDSMTTKFENFCVTTQSYLILKFGLTVTIETIREIYKKNSGIPRNEIYDKVSDRLNIDFSNQHKQEMSEILTAKNIADLASQRLFEDAINLIKKLVKLNKMVFISSSVPQLELDTLTKLKLPYSVYQNIKGIYGSHGDFNKGIAHIARIVESTSVSKLSCLVIGDDWADSIRSQKAGVDCILINRGDLERERNYDLSMTPLIINNLDEITICLK